MTLGTFNVGNTHCSLGLFEPGFRLLDQTGTRDLEIPEIRQKWVNILQDVRPSEVWISSVVPRAVPVLEEIVDEAGCSCHVCSHTDIPLELDVLTPETVGMDRLLNATAAFHLYGCSCLVVDVGTAVTWDVVLVPGVFAGGAIAPGPGLWEKALFGFTALPRVERFPVDSAVGKTTPTAIRAGLFFGMQAMVQGLATRIREEMGPLRGILTGGGLGDLDLPGFEQVPHLTHRGLALVAGLKK